MLLLGGRPVVLLSAAAAVAAGTTGLVLPHGGRGSAAVRPADLPMPHVQPWSWSWGFDGSGTIQVRSRHCPKSHPRKVGSFSYSTTRITNGRVEHHSASGSICAK
jgi:hypothetical protein